MRYQARDVGSSFIGRQLELRAIEQRLASQECRLLTVTGPGGVGKTRLVREYARAYVGKTAFAALADVEDADGIYVALAAALNLQSAQARQPKQHVFAYLAETPTLLILDNFEHLIAATAEIAELLSVPGVKLLVTSRERLRLPEEWVYPLAGLPLDDDALRLFAARAQQLRPDFDPAAEVPSIQAICNAVEGIPLALELATAWLSRLTCAEIAVEITRDLTFLRTPQRNGASPPISIEAVFEHSWRLLKPQQQRALSRLTIFRGGFTREAAAAVAGASLDDLGDLLDKSLLYHTRRYQLHEFTRQFARAKLDPQEGRSLEAAHGQYYLTLLAGQEADLKSSGQIRALDAIEADFVNIAAAWAWALRDGRDDLAADAVESLRLFAVMRCQISACAALIDTALAQTRAERRWARLMARRLQLLEWHGALNDDPQLTADAVRALAVAQNEHDQGEIAFNLRIQGHIAFSQHEYAAALQHYSASLEQYQALDAPYYVMELQRLVGHCHLFAGRAVQAVEPYRASLQLAHALGDQIGEAGAWMGLGGALHSLGDLVGAQAAHQQANQLQRATSNWGRFAWNLVNLAEIAFERGDIERALAYACEADEHSRTLDSPPTRRQALWMRLNLALMTEDYHQAEQQLASLEPQISLRSAAQVRGWIALGRRDANAARGHLQIALRAEPEMDVDYLIRHYAPLAALLADLEQRPADSCWLLALSDRFERDVLFQRWLPLQRLDQALRAALPESDYTAARAYGASADPRRLCAEMLAILGVEMPLPEDDSLSPRELEVLRLMVAGQSNRQIAAQLVVVPGTVKAHVHNILHKLDARNRTQAVVKARALRLV